MQKLAPKAFWLLVFILLPHWCKISRLYLVPVPNYWAWSKTTHQKKWFSWSNPYKIEVMITSLLEMLVTKPWSHDHIYNIIWITWENFVGDVIVKNYDVITFISKYLYFNKAWSNQFCWYHQNCWVAEFQWKNADVSRTRPPSVSSPKKAHPE